MGTPVETPSEFVADELGRIVDLAKLRLEQYRLHAAQLAPNSRQAIAAKEEVLERERVLLRLETWRSSLAEDVRVPVDVAKAMKCDRESLTRQVRTGRLERLGRKQRR